MALHPHQCNHSCTAQGATCSIERHLLPRVLRQTGALVVRVAAQQAVHLIVLEAITHPEEVIVMSYHVTTSIANVCP